MFTNNMICVEAVFWRSLGKTQKKLKCSESRTVKDFFGKKKIL
jgi:hypothetical protein